MSLHHFFLDEQVISAETDAVFPLRLSDDDIKHARVVRLEEGEHISVIDSSRDYFECEVVSFSRDGLFVRICSRLDNADLSAGPSIILVQGIAKGEKMDAIVRHATEVGVSGFIPLVCERSVVKLDRKKAEARVARWGSIAKSAAMQSGRLVVPEVSMPMKPANLPAALAGIHLVLVFWEEASGERLSDLIRDALARQGVVSDDARIAVVVGPEGGLSASEVECMMKAPNAVLASLGSFILRTETAGIVAPALVSYELGGMGNSH